MRNPNRSDATFLQSADVVEEQMGFLGLQRSGRLVENEQASVRWPGLRAIATNVCFAAGSLSTIAFASSSNIPRWTRVLFA